MRLISNAVDGSSLDDLVDSATNGKLTQIDLAVAYATNMEAVFELAEESGVPLNLYTLVDEGGFPDLKLARRFVDEGRLSWRLYLTRAFYHPKVMWFRGIGAYIGSANLTLNAWQRNVECGVWFEQDELEGEGWVERLDDMLEAVRNVCREATREDLEALKELHESAQPLRSAQSDFDEEKERIVGHLPSADLLSRGRSKRRRRGGARTRKLQQWNHGLTILRKITQFFEDHRDEWPQWLPRETPPSLAQDAATQHWWQEEFKHKEDTEYLLEASHSRNVRNPERAVREMFDWWREQELAGGWRRAVYDRPLEMRSLLSKERLDTLSVDELARIIHFVPSARGAARRIPKADLGVAPEATVRIPERAEFFAQKLWRERSQGGHTIVDLIRFVVWGDQQRKDVPVDCGKRVLMGAHDGEWSFHRVGVSTLQELVAYARPDDFPPNNDRVQKTLYALGFEGFSYR